LKGNETSSDHPFSGGYVSYQRGSNSREIASRNATMAHAAIAPPKTITHQAPLGGEFEIGN